MGLSLLADDVSRQKNGYRHCALIPYQCWQASAWRLEGLKAWRLLAWTVAYASLLSRPMRSCCLHC